MPEDLKPLPHSAARAFEPDALAEALAAKSLDPESARPAEWIQTHISHVFLTGTRVYKMRKAVKLPFLDFSSRAARNRDCENEIRLNRRLAPDVYLGLAPIQIDGRGTRLGPVTESIDDPDLEHVVVMRRLPGGRDALALLGDDQLRPEQLERVAAILGEFHAATNLGVPAPFAESEWYERTADPVLECVRSLSESSVVARTRTRSLDVRVRDRLEVLRTRFEERREQGRAVDAHGDLHLDHIWFETDDAAPLMIDCIEFNPELRRIDTASELAFLSMDLQYRGRQDLADCILSAYACETDDYGLFSVVDFFAAYRALVRAKVADLATRQDSIGPEQRDRARQSVEGHLDLAEELLQSERRPELIVLCGTVGCGKSTVARSLARSGRGIQIASDRVRKSLAGVSATARTGDGTDEGLYQPERTESVYRAMLQRADAVLESGRTPILDASFSRRAHREAARTWAGERGLTARLIEVRCSDETAAARLEAREKRGRDPSDAGPDFLPVSRSRFEETLEWPDATREIVWTD